MRTYLDLCNDLIRELGINGGNQLSTVSAAVNSLESARICGYIADADFAIQELHHNWRFMWRQFRAVLAAGGDILAVPSVGVVTSPGTNRPGQFAFYQMKRMDRESLVFAYGTDQATRPVFLPWRSFEALWQSRTKDTASFPSNWSLTPAGNPIISQKVAADSNYQYECWARPHRLQNDGDLSPLNLAYGLAFQSTDVVEPYSLSSTQLAIGPVRRITNSKTGNPFETIRIIIVRAKIIYAEIEGATEIMQGALAEYQDLLEALRADQLPGQEADRASESDVPMTVETV